MKLVALIFLLFSSLSDAVIYNTTGDKVVIFPGSAPDLITLITWYHNSDMAVEWSGGDPSPYRQFKGCTTLDTRTGALTISGLTQEHSGSYTAEINNKRVAGTTEIQVISPVPKPTVSQLCNAEMTSCTLTCEGDITDAGPVDYSWSVVDAHNYHKGQQFNLTQNDHDRWFQCEMNNPISSGMSEKFLNPFSSSRNRMFTIISVLVVVLILIGLIVGIYIYRKYMSKKGKKDKETVKAENVKLLAVVSNGVVPSLSTEESSAQNLQTSSVFLDISSQTAVMNGCKTSNPDNASEKPNDEPEISPDQVHTCEENPGSSAQTENSPKKEEETLDQALIDNPKTPESNHQTATTTSEALTSVAESNNKAAMDSQNQETSRNDPQPAASPDSAESSEESNGNETTRPLLEEPNRIISVSA